MQRQGRQTPTFECAPEYAYTDGDDAAALLESFGTTLDPWQKHVIDLWLARNADDKYAADSCGLSVPRQNGKTHLVRARCLYGAAVCGEKILFTSQELKTSRETFNVMTKLFKNYTDHPEMCELVDKIRSTNGQEAIMLKNGGCIEFGSRTHSASRGHSYDVVIYDEAQLLTDEQQDALLFTLAAAPSGNRQFIYLGTPPPPVSAGTVFARVRLAAHEGTDPTLAWCEWAVDEIGDVEDVNRWYETNPSLGTRLSEKQTHKELIASSPDGFARERLGWWSDNGAYERVIDKVAWSRCATENPPMDGAVAYGIKFSPDGTEAAIAAAIMDGDDPPHVELVNVGDVTHGMGWIVDFLAQRTDRARCFLADGRGTADTLVQRVMAAGAPSKYCRSARTSDVIKAAASMRDLVRSHSLTHYNNEQLNQSVIGASRRDIGHDGGFGFGEAPGVDPTPAEAASMALLALSTSKRDPQKEQEVISW